MRLLGTVEVPKDKRIKCERDGCNKAVYKRIHVVSVDGALQLVGGDCYRKFYRGMVDETAPWHGPGGEGRRLTADELERLLQNRDELKQMLADEYADWLARSEAERAALAEADHLQAESLEEDDWDGSEDIEMPPVLATRASKRRASDPEAERAAELKEWAMRLIYAPNDRVHPREMDAGSRTMASDSDMLAHAYYVERAAFRGCGLDPDQPGWMGGVKMEAVQRFVVMAMARRAGSKDWLESAGVSKFDRMAAARQAKKPGWWQSY